METILIAATVTVVVVGIMMYFLGHRHGVETERGRDSFRKAYRERTEAIREQK